MLPMQKHSYKYKQRWFFWRRQIFVIYNFIENGIDIMQKNNLPDNWREVRSDTKSKPRIDYSTPFKFLYASFRKSRRKIKIRWTMKPIRRISIRRRNPKSIFRQLFMAHSTISHASVPSISRQATENNHGSLIYGKPVNIIMWSFDIIFRRATGDDLHSLQNDIA